MVTKENNLKHFTNFFILNVEMLVCWTLKCLNYNVKINPPILIFLLWLVQKKLKLLSGSHDFSIGRCK